jgi:hypothetical protein
MLPVAQKLGDSSHWPMHLAASFLLLGLLAVAHRGSSSQSSLPNLSTWSVLLLLAVAVSGFWTVPLFAASEAKLAVGRYAGYAAAALIGWRFGLRSLPALAWGPGNYGAQKLYVFGHSISHSGRLVPLGTKPKQREERGLSSRNSGLARHCLAAHPKHLDWGSPVAPF